MFSSKVCYSDTYLPEIPSHLIHRCPAHLLVIPYSVGLKINAFLERPAITDTDTFS